VGVAQRHLESFVAGVLGHTGFPLRHMRLHGRAAGHLSVCKVPVGWWGKDTGCWVHAMAKDNEIVRVKLWQSCSIRLQGESI